MSPREKQLYSTACKLFREKGYVATTMREIAGAMGMEAASLYEYIDSKENLLDHVCFSMADRFIKALDEVNDIYFNAAEKLQMAVKAHVDIITDDPEATAVFIQEWKHLPAERLEAFRELRRRYEQGFVDILKTGQEEGVFAPIDLKFGALTVLSAINWIYAWYQPEGKMKPHEIAHAICHVLLNGLNQPKHY